MKKQYGIFFLSIVFILFIALFSVGLFSQQTKEKLQTEKQQIEKDIAYTNVLLSETRKNKKISLSQLIILNNKINQREGLISAINNEITDIDGRIVNNAAETEKLTARLRQYKESYAKLIIFAYKNRNSFNRLMFLFASDDLNQAFLRLKYLQQYTRYRRKQAEQIMATTNLIKENIIQLKTIKTGKTSLLLSQKSEKIILAQEKEEKNSAVKKLLQKEKELAKTIKQKEKDAKKLQQSIQAVIAAEIAKAAETAKAAEKNKAKTNAATTSTAATASATKTVAVTATSKELGLSEADITLSNSFISNKGKLPWPVEKGIVTGTFGVHPHPVLSDIKVKNNGIDISTSAGLKARSVFDGKVTGVINIPGANKAVLVRHGEYITVYYNLSEVNVKTGDTVKTKQSIGYIFTDNDEAKTELHFEVWYGKEPVNPVSWLSGSK